MSKLQRARLQVLLSKPTIILKPKNFKLALYGHVLALISAALLALFGLIGLINNFLPALMQIIAALVIIAIELLYIDVEILNQGLVRGLIYIILVLLVFGISGFGAESLLSLMLIIAAVFDMVHDFN